MKIFPLMMSGLLVLAIGCASEPQIQVDLDNGPSISGANNPFTDATVVDVIFVVTNVVPDTDVLDASGNVVIPKGAILDNNDDNLPDTIIFPSDCGSQAPASCGFSPKDAEFALSGVKLNLRYTVAVRFRNASAQVEYEGTAPFDNIEDAPTLTIVVNTI